MRRQQLGRAQQCRHMDIMAAGVHPAFFAGGKGQAGLLLHRQRIHIRAESHGLAGMSAPQRPHHRRIQHLLHLNAQILQIRLNDTGGAELLVARLGVCVDVSAYGDQFFLNGLRFVQKVSVHKRSPLSFTFSVPCIRP